MTTGSPRSRTCSTKTTRSGASELNRPVYDLHARMAFVETDEPANLAGFITRFPVAPTESVTITKYMSPRGSS